MDKPRMAPEMSPAGIPMTGQGWVVSDLHLFAARSNALTCIDALRPRLAQARVLILNGDTFDFRWSVLGNQAATQEAALDWLREWIRRLPECEIHFVLGNHDCLASFTQEYLPRLAESEPRFHWHEYWLSLGSALFLHGDCVHYSMDRTALERYRAGWKGDRRRGQFGGAKAYACVDRLGLTELAHRWHFPRQRTLDRLTHYLSDVSAGWQQKTKHCYFGHTHRAFTGAMHEGVCFYNTGSAIRGMEFAPITFDLATLFDGSEAV